MIRIGLTGSIASGKSEVERILQDYKIPVFDADGFVHRIYNDGTAALLLANICPSAIEGPKINRQTLLALIKQNPQLLSKIEAIIHPLVREAENQFFAEAKSFHHKLAATNSPLLIETSRDKDMDVVIVVDAPAELRLRRALKRPSMTEDKFRIISSKQMPAAEKRKHAHYFIENNSSLEELRIKIIEILNELQAS
ncbi:MAG: dephospho-CoA kinase [Alphaproteobacteria bacterium]|nr:dephospho-CoA kinase [Alphaproteobacteria bacterium]